MKYYPNITQSFVICGMLLLSLILFGPVAIILNKLIGKEAAFLIYYLLAVGTTFWIVCLIKKKKTGNISFNFSLENKRVIPFVIFGAIFLYCGIVSPITALMSESHKEAFLNNGSQTGIITLFQSIIAAPILEELIFRGIILDGLLKKYSALKSILISSLLFGLIHLNPSQLVVGLIMGIFTGWIYYKTRMLTLSFLIHSVYNLASVLMGYFLISDLMKDNTLLGMFGGLANLIYVVVGSVIVILICIYFLEKEFNKKKIEMEANKTTLASDEIMNN
jgi:membrane protease YdiL (CAAX protease family)